MSVVVKKGSRAPILLLLAGLLLAAQGCAHREKASVPKEALEGIRTILVIGFKPAILPGQERGMVRNPVTGALRYADPVPQDAADKLTQDLLSRLVRAGGYVFIPPREATSPSSFTRSRSGERADLDLYIQIGESLAADAFLAGSIWRWKERRGGDLSVESPASVDFDLFLVRLDDRAMVWKYEYDKTQQSLAENFLDLRTFVRAKGKWLTAFDLAELGIEEIVDSFPKKGVEKGTTDDRHPGD